MTTSRRPAITRLAWVLCALLPSLIPNQAARAEGGYDLKRTTPVPSDQQIPAADFFRPALLQAPRINPAGTQIAAVVTAGEDHHLLMVYDVKARQYGMVGGNGDYDINQFSWLGDTRIVFQLSSRKLFGIGLFAVEVRNLGEPYPLLQYAGSMLVSVPRSDRLSPIVWNSYDGLQGSAHDTGAAVINSSMLSRNKGADILTAKMNDFGAIIQSARENNDIHTTDRYPLPPDGNTTGYLSDKDGNLEFATTVQDGHSYLHRLVDRTWVRCPVDLDHVAVFGSGNKLGELVARPGHEEGKPRPLRFLEAATGAWGGVIVDDKGYDFVGGVYRDPVNGEIIGALADREGPHNLWFNDAYRRYQDTLNRSFPGLYVRILGTMTRRPFSWWSPTRTGSRRATAG